MSSIKDQVRAGMATWPSFKDFVCMLAGGSILGGIGGFSWGALQDAWHSSNPWIYVPAGAALAIGWVVWHLAGDWGGGGAGDAPPSKDGWDNRAQQPGGALR